MCIRDSLNLALYKVVGDSILNCVVRDTSDRVVPRRIFQNDDETISVLCQQHPSISSVTVAHYLFDSELNLIESSIGDTIVKRAEFSEAIKDSESNFIFLV